MVTSINPAIDFDITVIQSFSISELHCTSHKNLNKKFFVLSTNICQSCIDYIKNDYLKSMSLLLTNQISNKIFKKQCNTEFHQWLYLILRLNSIFINKLGWFALNVKYSVLHLNALISKLNWKDEMNHMKDEIWLQKINSNKHLLFRCSWVYYFIYLEWKKIMGKKNLE